MHGNEEIKDSQGNVIRRSNNLAGIRRYVSRNGITLLTIAQLPADTKEVYSVHGGRAEGKLTIEFDNGATYETCFADFSVLRDFVRKWRNAYGALLQVNGKDAGKVDSKNTALLA
jgi:hypothetical protein